MPHAEFVHLRVRSAFSLLQSTVRVEPLAKACRAGRMPAVALTDDTNLFAVMQFCAAAKKAGVQPIVGAMVALAPLEALPRTPGRPAPPEHVVLLAKDQAGYGNLLRLLSRAWTGAEPGAEIRIPLERLVAGQAGLICLSGGPQGPIGAALRRGDAKLARRLATELKAAFGDRFYMELIRHDAPEDIANTLEMLDVAYGLNIELGATSNMQ